MIQEVEDDGVNDELSDDAERVVDVGCLRYKAERVLICSVEDPGVMLMSMITIFKPKKGETPVPYI